MPPRGSWLPPERGAAAATTTRRAPAGRTPGCRPPTPPTDRGGAPPQPSLHATSRRPAQRQCPAARRSSSPGQSRERARVLRVARPSSNEAVVAELEQASAEETLDPVRDVV